MSTRNPTVGTAIRDIVRRGQETLVRLYLAGKHQERLEYAKKALSSVSHCRDMSPPQTLGELCLELHGQTWRNARCITPFWMFYDYGVATANANALRRAMFHKHPNWDDYAITPEQMVKIAGGITSIHTVTK